MLLEKIENAPTIEPERTKDIINKFRDYQIDWLKSHGDIEFPPAEEELIVGFLKDTAECYLREVEHEMG